MSPQQHSPSWHPIRELTRTPPSSFCALNTCAPRHLGAAGSRSASEAAHLVQGTQVSSDAGHDDVHCRPAPAGVRKHRHLFEREKGMAGAWRKGTRFGWTILLPEGAVERVASQGVFGVVGHVSGDNHSSRRNSVNAFCD
jgi:hypothetical protein